MNGITQSLAGRIAMARLLPFTLTELYGPKKPSLETVLFRGFYPPVHDRRLDPSTWYANYVQTYVERDVRRLLNVRDLSSFQRFLRLCAGRAGQLLNLSQLGADAGINHNTAKAWISILEASDLVFLLQPHHTNFNKRIIKTPKLYFQDTGLASWLLAIREPEQLATHPARGALFENLVATELMKDRFNAGRAPDLYFWRDRAGHEVDLIIEKVDRLIPIEIKSGQTLNADFFRGLETWQDIAASGKAGSWLVYGGREAYLRNQTHVLSWRDLSPLLKDR